MPVDWDWFDKKENVKQMRTKALQDMYRFADIVRGHLPLCRIRVQSLYAPDEAFYADQYILTCEMSLIDEWGDKHDLSVAHMLSQVALYDLKYRQGLAWHIAKHFAEDVGRKFLVDRPPQHLSQIGLSPFQLRTESRKVTEAAEGWEQSNETDYDSPAMLLK